MRGATAEAPAAGPWLVRAARDWLAAAGNLAFPWRCAICEADGDGAPFCPDCRRELVEAGGPSCPRCAMPVGPFARLDGGCSECRDKPLGFDAAIALGPYEGPIRHLCLALKHEPAAWMARWLADVWIEARADALPIADDEDVRVVAVPLHWWRRLGRGYDQAEALADELARRLGRPACRALRRARPTAKLAGLTRTARRRALRGAFRVPSRALDEIRGRTIVLVDDVLTTGATCGTAARALKRAGARRVIVAVLGRADGQTHR